MPRPSPVPNCRRPGCGQPAVDPYGYCLGHDLQYAQWRAWRDELELEDLADAGVPPGGKPGPITESALDVLWRYLTPGPFSRPDA